MKIAIAGYGLEGEASYRYWATDDNQVTIVDEKQPERAIPTGALTLFGEHAFEQLNGFDLVIRTPGLSPYKIKTDGKIWSATNEFFVKSPAKIIGVTGSKGKGTTASLIGSILEASGKKVWLVGNIGISALDALENIGSEDVVVFELSSFQLWDLEMSPHIAVVLLIEPEHLNVHLDMDDYVNAKSHIRMHQTAIDSCVYHPTNPYSRQIAKKSEQGKTYRYGIIDDGAVYERGGLFYQGEQAICSINNLQLIGDHNIDNACAAITAARLYEPTITIDSIEKGLKNFSGLPHRLQFIKTVNSVRYYDDSIATTPSSAIAALRAIDGEKVIILGGSFKGSDFTELARELLRQRSKAILIGDEAESIARASEAVGFTDYEIHTNPTMQMIVERAAQLAVAGGSVLLSPASASFGLFKNYEDRGNQFAAAVDSL